MSDSDDHSPPPSAQPPPPSTQSHFATFENFVPDEDASFDQEFTRLALSQQWVPGSQDYTRERTIAMREELKLHYFTPPDAPVVINEAPELAAALTEEQKLKGYQDLCDEIGIPPSDSIEECKKQLKSTLVNIVDLIDARRTRSVAKVWQNFEDFRDYTLQDEHRINKEEAKKGEGFLASLLQDFNRSRRRRRDRSKRDTLRSTVLKGRVSKRRGNKGHIQSPGD